MIGPVELYHILHRKPFQPFRVHVKDGRVYDIRHEHLAVVGRTYLSIGIPVPNQEDPFADYIDTVDLSDIVRVETADGLAPTGND
jgi:hypothetical protein